MQSENGNNGVNNMNNNGQNQNKEGAQQMQGNQNWQANNGQNFGVNQGGFGAQNMGQFGAQQQSMGNPYYNGQQTGYNYKNPYYMQNSSSINSLLGHTTSDRFIRGLVIGAAATYLLTNEKAQKAIIKTGMKLYGTIAGGVEELKEKVMDAKAELQEEKVEGEQN